MANSVKEVVKVLEESMEKEVEAVKASSEEAL